MAGVVTCTARTLLSMSIPGIANLISDQVSDQGDALFYEFNESGQGTAVRGQKWMEITQPSKPGGEHHHRSFEIRDSTWLDQGRQHQGGRNHHHSCQAGGTIRIKAVKKSQEGRIPPAVVMVTR